jgi:hypothetical protein
LKILNVWPVTDSGGGRFRDVAVFDAEVVDGLRLNGLRLSKTNDGKRFVFSPAKHGVRFAQFHGVYAQQLADAAWAAHEGRVANENNR